MVKTKREQLAELFVSLENSKTLEIVVGTAKKIQAFVEEDKESSERALRNFPTAIGRVKFEKGFSEEKYKILYKELIPIVYAVAHAHLSFCEEKSLEKINEDSFLFDRKERLFMQFHRIYQTAGSLVIV